MFPLGRQSESAVAPTRAVVLLANCTYAVSEMVGQIIAAIKGCDLDAVAAFREVSDRVGRGDVGLVVAFLDDHRDEKALVDLLGANWCNVVPTIVLLAQADAQQRLVFLGLGAVDCLPCPIDLSRLALLIDILTIRRRCGHPIRAAATVCHPSESVLDQDGFLVSTDVLRTLFEQFRRVAPLDTTVMLTGETGCGKTHAARVIHDLSPRRHKPFVVVQCAALSPTLLESELFGHVKGAFTGADRDYPGKLASAEDGTLFLDEVDSVPLACQAKLLRAVDDRQFESVGSTKTLHVRARLIVAASQPLEPEVAQGRFRADLYYRLNVVTFDIPPLRERRAALKPLAEKFLAVFCPRTGKTILGFTEAALHAMETYRWPGNVRELRNAIERAVVLCDGNMIDMVDLPDAVQRSYCAVAQVCISPLSITAGNELAAARNGSELERLLKALRDHNQNRTEAAAELGISRVTLYKKLHRYGLDQSRRDF